MRLCGDRCKSCGRGVCEDASICFHCGESAPALDIQCPECNSGHISINNSGGGLKELRDLSFDKVRLGFRTLAFELAYLGCLDSLWDTITKKRIKVICKSCGHSWAHERKILKMIHLQREHL